MSENHIEYVKFTSPASREVGLVAPNAVWELIDVYFRQKSNDSTAGTLFGLSDTDLSTITDNSGIIYDAASNKWKSEAGVIYVHPNHSGHVVSAGDGATTIQPNVVSTAMLEQVSGWSFLGQPIDSSVENVDVVNMTTARTMLNVADGSNNYTHPNHSGDVTSVADGAQTIVADAVTYSKMQNVVANDRLLGNVVGAGQAVAEIGATDIRTMINVADGANNYSHPNHTGDVTSSGDGAQTITNNVVTYAKMQQDASDMFLGRDTGGVGNLESISMSTARTMLNVADGATNYSHPNHSGDVTSVGDGAQTIVADAVTYAKIQNVVANNRLLGNVVSAGAAVAEIGATDIRTMINVDDGANNYSHPNHTGMVTSSGDGATTIVANVVSLNMMEQMPTDSFLGRDTASVGNVEVLSIATVQTMLGIGTPYTHPNHTGDVTSVGDGAQTIVADAVTYAKMQNVVANDRLLGNVVGAGQAVAEIGATDIRTMINVADGAEVNDANTVLDDEAATRTALLRLNDDIGIHFGTSTSQSRILSNGTNTQWLLDEGDLGIYDALGNEDFRFDVNDGDFHADGDIIGLSTTIGSDRRLKKNIKPISEKEALNIISKLEPVTYNKKANNRFEGGLIAQDVEKELPHLVSEHRVLNKGNEKYKHLNYVGLVPYLIGAIKSLEEHIEELEK